MVLRCFNGLHTERADAITSEDAMNVDQDARPIRFIKNGLGCLVITTLVYLAIGWGKKEPVVETTNRAIFLVPTNALTLTGFQMSRATGSWKRLWPVPLVAGIAAFLLSDYSPLNFKLFFCVGVMCFTFALASQIDYLIHLISTNERHRANSS
jgi:hypothetical protein